MVTPAHLLADPADSACVRAAGCCPYSHRSCSPVVWTLLPGRQLPLKGTPCCTAQRACQVRVEGACLVVRPYTHAPAMHIAATAIAAVYQQHHVRASHVLIADGTGGTVLSLQVWAVIKCNDVQENK